MLVIRLILHPLKFLLDSGHLGAAVLAIFEDLLNDLQGLGQVLHYLPQLAWVELRQLLFFPLLAFFWSSLMIFCNSFLRFSTVSASIVKYFDLEQEVWLQ